VRATGGRLDQLTAEAAAFFVSAKPRAHHEFRPDINGLRALAVLSVLAFHAGLPAPGGFVGVDIFFVISGFLITRIILSERAAGKFSFADFYGKRVKRILPALLVVLFSSWIAGWLLLAPVDFRRFGGHMEGSSYFSVNLWIYRLSVGPDAYFQPHYRYMPLLHLWSLSIEEQFYLIWPALMLGLFRMRRFMAPAIALIFLASFIFSIVLTRIDSTAAFFFLSSRAWELALGALLAYREVFGGPPRPSPAAADFRAGLGLALMLGSVFLLGEAWSWPGAVAFLPTFGCGLVISAPGARISAVLLENRVAQFFGLISYPLYLWHWPLLSLAHHLKGDDLPLALAIGLLGAATLLAFLTWRLIEKPAAALYGRSPLRAAAPLLAGLALAGLVGSATRRANGFPGRFPPQVEQAFDFHAEGAGALNRCAQDTLFERGALPEERAKAKSFYADRGCLKIEHPGRPIVVLLGDSHAMHFLTGLETVYGDRINLVVMGALGCAPLVVKTDWTSGIAVSNRCRALNEAAIQEIVALKPAAIIVGAFFAEFYHLYYRAYPGFARDFDANVAALRAAGVRAPILVMGEVPTWTQWMPAKTARDLLAKRNPATFTREQLDPDSVETEARLSAHKWGAGVTYVSQFAKLCDERGCRRLVGPRLPNDMITMDYGHYTPAGSIYAVKNILAPALDPILAKAEKN
jgi:peptidoglycan/LPS O-acetylase OafA/YrhL